MPTKLAADILKYSEDAIKFQTPAQTLNALTTLCVSTARCACWERC